MELQTQKAPQLLILLSRRTSKSQLHLNKDWPGKLGPSLVNSLPRRPTATQNNGNSNPAPRSTKSQSLTTRSRKPY